MGSWRPLARAEETAGLLDLATGIADALAGVATERWDASLASGHAGVALLYAYLAAASGRPADADRARLHRDRAITKLAEDPMDATLWDGFPGVAWAVEQVDGLVDLHGDDRNEDIDVVLEEMLTQPALWPLPHDLVTGVTGAGLYAVSRLPRSRARRSLELVLDRLEEAADKDDSEGLYWWTPADQIDDEELARDYPSGYGDLGVAHGVPGAIGLLGLVAGAGVGGDRAGRLLRGAVKWLSSQAIPGRDGATFPVWTAPNVPEEDRGPARSAWCYGDPGVAAVLMRAAQGAEEPEWTRDATALAIRAARLPVDETGVEYAGFCHGAAGLAHVYNRLYQATGEAELRCAAQFWLNDTVTRCRAARSVAPDDPTWVLGGAGASSWIGADIVDGAAGVGLVLLAAATAVEPAWDRMFLLS